MRAGEILVRRVEPGYLPRLESFRCSTGLPWEDLVEQQIRGPLPRRYLASPPRFDGRMLIGLDRRDELLVVGAHHTEPTLVPDVGYTEVVAVALGMRGTLVTVDANRVASLGEFMLLAIFKQMRRLGRHDRTFARVDRRNVSSLALCDRVGLREQRPDPHSELLVQRWGDLPPAEA